MHEPLLAPLAALAAGILMSRLVGFELRELLWALAALTLVTLLACWRGTRRTAITCGMVTLVFAGALLDSLHRPGPPPELDAGPRELVILSGCVVEPPVFFDDRAQFVLELAPGARARVNLYLKEDEQPPALRYGQQVELEGRVRRPHNFENPGSFDYVNYLARKNIYWTASARSGSEIRVLPGKCGSRFHATIYALRTAALDRLERLYADDGYTLAMTRAMLLGESSKLEKVWIEQFRRTGTYHALVISGLHVTVLAGFLLFLLRLFRLKQEAALLLTTVLAWLYALITGWGAPVIRAAAGLTLFYLGSYFYRRSRLLNLLAAIAVAFLVFDPEEMFDASFHLSFLSVALIGALALPLLERTSVTYGRGLRGLADVDRDLHLPPKVAQFRVELRLLAETLGLWTGISERWSLAVAGTFLRGVFHIYELVTVSAVIQIGLALPMVTYFHRVSFSGLSANAIVVPAMTLVVPMGFVAILTGWTVPAAVTKWLLIGILKVVEWHQQWEPNWRVPNPPLWLAASCLLAILLVAVMLRTLPRFRIAAVALMMTSFGVLLWHPFAPRVTPGVMELTAIDVGQGESLLVALPRGGLMVVDGGGIPIFGGRTKPRLDIGEDVVSPYLWSRSIRRVDVLVATHGHEDHIGGLAALLDNFRPKELWVGATGASPVWLALRDRAVRQGVKIVSLRAGRTFELSGARVEVLAPLRDYIAAEEPHNNDSLVFRLSFGARSFLLTGDIEQKLESQLLAEGLLRRTDVLKVPHHGSRTSAFPGFIDAVKPSLAVISAGFENAYRLPHRELLDRLAAGHTAVFRTDQWGLVSIRSDGRRLQVDSRHWWSRPEDRLRRRAAF